MRTRADILRDIAELEDELAVMDGYLNTRSCGVPTLNYESKERELYKMRRQLANIPAGSNVQAYEYHIISNTELDLDRILIEGIRGIKL